MFEQVLSLWQRENTMTNTNIHDQAGFEAGVTRSRAQTFNKFGLRPIKSTITLNSGLLYFWSSSITVSAATICGLFIHGSYQINYQTYPLFAKLDHRHQ